MQCLIKKKGKYATCQHRQAVSVRLLIIIFVKYLIVSTHLGSNGADGKGGTGGVGTQDGNIYGIFYFELFQQKSDDRKFNPPDVFFQMMKVINTQTLKTESMEEITWVFSIQIRLNSKMHLLQ